MKVVKLFIGLAFALVASSASAQDFNDPQYAKWGDSAEQRKENILASTFLKEELANRNYNQAAKYLQQLLQNCPGASENTFVRGVTLYKNKITRAKSLPRSTTFPPHFATSLYFTVPVMEQRH